MAVVDVDLATFSLPSPFTLDPAEQQFFDQADMLSLDVLMAGNPDFDAFEFPTDVPQMEDGSSPDVYGLVPTGMSPCTTDDGASGCGRKRRPKQRVPDHIRMTAKYQERRRKNTMAAARNREMKRLQAMSCTSKLPSLDKKNGELRSECAALRSELAVLVSMVKQRAALLA